MPSYEDIDDVQQQQNDDKSAVSSSADSQHIQLDTASIIEPGENAGVDLDLENTGVDPVGNTAVDMLENQGHELTKSEHFEHAVELGRTQANTDKSTQGTRQN